jgi:hypothetical protein
MDKIALFHSEFHLCFPPNFSAPLFKQVDHLFLSDMRKSIEDEAPQKQKMHGCIDQ